MTKEALIYSYVFTFAVLLTIMTNVSQYFYFHPPPLHPGQWPIRRWLPFMFQVAATCFLLVSPLKNLVVNVCMASFREHGYDSTIGHVLEVAYMPMFATEPCQIYTWLGYVFMTVGTVLQVDLFNKLHTTVTRAQYEVKHPDLPASKKAAGG